MDISINNMNKDINNIINNYLNYNNLIKYYNYKNRYKK